MSGSLKITQKDIIKLSNLPATEIRRVVAEFSKNPAKRVDFSSTSGAIPKNMPLKEQLEKMQIGLIKDMPEYVPDAEIRSLSLTVPSWASSIKRVLETAKFKEASDEACAKLNKELDELKEAIGTIVLAIKERK